MVEKKILMSIIISFLILIALIHTIFQLTIFGTGIPGFYQSGISGFSIGEFSTIDFKKTNQKLSTPSSIILIGEWTILIVIITITIIKGKINLKRELHTIKLKEKHAKGKNKTDIDILYDILKDKKHLHLQTIAKIFKVNKDVAKIWSQALEDANLATIQYPRFGDPEITINEDH